MRRPASGLSPALRYCEMSPARGKGRARVGVRVRVRVGVGVRRDEARAGEGADVLEEGAAHVTQPRRAHGAHVEHAAVEVEHEARERLVRLRA